ncbi:MAG: hypothetical protein ACI9YT_001936 [Halobacteriales archaeon]|jgi:hypothetical protein
MVPRSREDPIVVFTLFLPSCAFVAATSRFAFLRVLTADWGSEA